VSFTLLDSEIAPTAANLDTARAEVGGWAGYLDSGWQANAWTVAELAAARATVGLLPVWVAPLNTDHYPVDGTTGAEHASNAYAQVHAVSPDALTVCLDVEPSASLLPGMVDYSAAFCQVIHDHGGVVVGYGGLTWLEHNSTTVERYDAAWLASWLLPAGNVPAVPPNLAGWPLGPDRWTGLSQRAWQYGSGVSRYGVTVDVSTASSAFPVLRVPAPTPPGPAPAPPILSVRFGNGQTVTGPGPVTVTTA
jgi:hypothetical protein